MDPLFPLDGLLRDLAIVGHCCEILVVLSPVRVVVLQGLVS